MTGAHYAMEYAIWPPELGTVFRSVRDVTATQGEGGPESPALLSGWWDVPPLRRGITTNLITVKSNTRPTDSHGGRESSITKPAKRVGDIEGR